MQKQLPLHYITQHRTSTLMTLHHTNCNCEYNYHYIAVRYTTLITLDYTTLQLQPQDLIYTTIH